MARKVTGLENKDLRTGGLGPKFLFFGLMPLFLGLFVYGCTTIGESRQATKPGTEPIKSTPADQRKAKLLKQIDRRFENPDAHFELGQLYQADGLLRKAEYHYNVALSFEPAHKDAQTGIVKVLIEAGDTDRATLTADIYMNQVSVSAVGLLELGLGFQKQGLDDYALNCYQQALRLAPSSAKINRQIGYYYLSRNNKELAREYLTRSFQLDPRQPDVAGELGRLGVAVRIPRKTERDTKKLDRMVQRSDERMEP